MSESLARNPAEAEILARIARRGAIPFAEFMEVALYRPEGGYYMRPKSGETSGMVEKSPEGPVVAPGRM